MSHVFLILCREVLLASVIPALMPEEASEFVSLAFIGGEVVSDFSEGFLHFGEKLGVFLAGISRPGWPKEAAEGLASPRTFDEKNLFFKVITDDVAKCEFRADAIGSGSESWFEIRSDQVCFRGLVAVPNIRTLDPTVFILQIGKLLLAGRKREVAVFVHCDTTVALHVGLAGEDENLHRLTGIDNLGEGGTGSGEYDEKNGG
jgi:hypothetical protein